MGDNDDVEANLVHTIVTTTSTSGDDITLANNETDTTGSKIGSNTRDVKEGDVEANQLHTSAVTTASDDTSSDDITLTNNEHETETGSGNNTSNMKESEDGQRQRRRQQRTSCSSCSCSCSSYLITKCNSIPFALRETFDCAATKIFLGGFFWQAFSFAASSQSINSWQFALASGLGDAVGVFGGNMLRLWLDSISANQSSTCEFVTSWNSNDGDVLRPSSSSETTCCCGCGGGLVSRILRIFFTPDNYPGHNNALRGSAAVCLGAFIAGLAWQPMLNVSKNHFDFAFNASMGFVGLVCGSLFFVGYAIGIFLFIQRNVWSSSSTEFIRQISLAIGVMGAAAFFVGTDVDFHGRNIGGFGVGQNWLANIVGERGGNPIVDCFKAGFSTALGFMIVGTILILIVPTDYLWTTSRYQQQQQNIIKEDETNVTVETVEIVETERSM